MNVLQGRGIQGAAPHAEEVQVLCMPFTVIVASVATIGLAMLVACVRWVSCSG